MKLLLDINIISPDPKIDYRDKILLSGSCFTEHIGNQLQDLKFQVLENPNGILFDPISVAGSLVSYIQNKKYTDSDLFHLNELWQSWQHHGRFSGLQQENVLAQINQSQETAHEFLKDAKWLILTLGTSFSYRLASDQQPVANCHRAPAQLFHKHLMTIEEINAFFDDCLYQLFRFNPDLRVIFTVSPVRHIRDGIVENNRSKARLIESVHHLVNKFDQIYYFPAYELVIDVLRDYRFYDIDLVHPNFQATQFVLEKFMQYFVNDESRSIAEEVQKILIARNHKPFQATTQAHRKFLQLNSMKTKVLIEKYPFLQLDEELNYFSSSLV